MGLEPMTARFMGCKVAQMHVRAEKCCVYIVCGVEMALHQCIPSDNQ